MKKIVTRVLAGAMCLGMMTTAFAADMTFTDVAESDWYYNDVKSAVESGLVSGKADTEYAPGDMLTYAEAIKLAACMNQLYVDGSITLTPGTPWYQSFVDYCTEKQIITKEYNYTEYATRAGYMEIFANALPAEGLEATNNIPDDAIPDVPSSSEYAAGVYKLYRAGILTGVDEAHNCNPGANITRAEVAAILTRMMDADKRIAFNMGEEPEAKPEKEPEKKDDVVIDGLTITKQPEDVNAKVGVMSEFKVEVAGNKGLCDYQWQYKSGEQWFDLTNTGTTIMDATSDTLKLYAQDAMEMTIRCVVSDSVKEVETNEVSVVVTAAE